MKKNQILDILNETMQTVALGRPSAWKKSITAYIGDFIKNLDEVTDEEVATVATVADLKRLLLNGAENWKQYSYSGLSLCYDYDIAKRVCTPSEFKKKSEGNLPPSNYLSWLDVQYCRLISAWSLVAYTASKSLPKE